MDDKTTQKKILHALAASCIACQAASFLQGRCEKNYLNKKMKTPLKNLRIYVTHVLKGTMSRDFLLLSLTPVANLELRISPRIFEKIRNDPNGILRGLGDP